MGKRQKKPPSLSPLENAVMQVIWNKGSASAEEVRLALASENDLKDSTVRTLLRRLEDKGALEHSTVGRAYEYHPKVEPNHLAGNAVQGIADRFCQGSLSSLLLGMASDSRISAEELRELADRIELAKQVQRETDSMQSPKMAKNRKKR